MRSQSIKNQQGVALVIGLLMLTILTLIGLSAMETSQFELKMAGNTQDFYNSFQKADAGVFAIMSFSRVSGLPDANKPFDGNDNLTPFAGLNKATNPKHPLSEINDNTIDGNGDADVVVDVVLKATGLPCPRAEVATSADLIECEFYQVESEHTDTQTSARTHLFQGVSKELIKP